MPQNKILIVGPAWVGDMVMAQGLFKLIKQREPNAIIDVVAPPWSVAITEFMPEVRQAIPLDIAHGKLALSKRYALAKQLRGHYQQAIILPNSFKSALLPFFAKVPRRSGWLGEQRYWLLNDYRRLDKKVLPRMMQRFWALALQKNDKLQEPLPLPKFVVEQEKTEKIITQFELMTDKPLLGLCPGAEFGASKRWPEHYFAEVAQQKIRQGYQVLLFGSRKDRIVTEKINQLIDNKAIDLAGKTHLTEAVVLLNACRQVITNDSGLMHIAAALDKPQVALFGSSSPDFTPPLSDKAQVVYLKLSCSPCFKRECPLNHHHCMQKITPEHILALLDSE